MNVSLKDALTQQIKILDLLDEFDVPVNSTSNGNFDYCCRCPNLDHKNGKENTYSCYINSEKNSFHCFGCSAGTNSIDFYILCMGGISFSEALQDLKTRIDIQNFSYEKTVEQNNLSILLNISNLLKEYRLSYQDKILDDIIWFQKLNREVQQELFSLNPREVEKAEKIYTKVKNTLEKRYTEDN